MAPFVGNLARVRTLLPKTLVQTLGPPARRLFISEVRRSAFRDNLLCILRTEISEVRRSAFRDILLRVLRMEISYASSELPSLPQNFSSFSIHSPPCEQWVRLTRPHHPSGETVEVYATAVDGAAPSSRTGAADPNDSSTARFHISVIIEVSKGEASDFVLHFVCSAWPDAMDVEKVFTVRQGAEKALQPFMGPDFGELNEVLQGAVREYLEERGVNNELAEFLHGYMEGKDRGEMVRWLENVESYVKK